MKNREPLLATGDFRRLKLAVALMIMSVGLLVALAWHGVQGWVLSRGYPYNTFLFAPVSRFGDFTDNTLAASRPNPYIDPYASYLPLAWVFLRAMSIMHNLVGVIILLSIGIGGLFLLLVKTLESVTLQPAKRVLYSLLFLSTSYPILLCFDRGNIEIIVVLLVASALYLTSRGKYKTAAGCLLPTVCFKVYPALFFLLLLRQRQLRIAAYSLIAFFAITILSLWALSVPLNTGFELYGRDMVFFTRVYMYENSCLEGSASLWNTYKVFLITLAQFKLIAPVDFSFDGHFIQTSYLIYTGCSAVLAIVLALYVCLLEKEFLRCAICLLCFLALATPTGADYRLLYANLGLVLAILLKTRRNHDLLALVLLALAMAPKKEILLTYAGKTETGYADISIQVILDPLLVFAALFYFLYDSRAYIDLRWSKLRWQRLLQAITPEKSISIAGRPKSDT